MHRYGKKWVSLNGDILVRANEEDKHLEQSKLKCSSGTAQFGRGPLCSFLIPALECYSAKQLANPEGLPCTRAPGSNH